MIEMTTAMVQALWRKLPSEVQEGREPDDVESWVEAVLAVVERDYVTERRCEHGSSPRRCGPCSFDRAVPPVTPPQ